MEKGPFCFIVDGSRTGLTRSRVVPIIKWRRRESNEETNSPKPNGGSELEKELLFPGVSGECAKNNDCPSVTAPAIPAILVRAWPYFHRTSAKPSLSLLTLL